VNIIVPVDEKYGSHSFHPGHSKHGTHLIFSFPGEQREPEVRPVIHSDLVAPMGKQGDNRSVFTRAVSQTTDAPLELPFHGEDLDLVVSRRHKYLSPADTQVERKSDKAFGCGLKIDHATSLEHRIGSLPRDLYCTRLATWLFVLPLPSGAGLKEKG
jgi:hypothetical protein